MFIVNLALFDLLMMLEMPMLITNSFLERMIGWQLGCDIYGTLGSVSGIGSAINNAAIAFDRYRYRFWSSLSNLTNWPSGYYRTISCPIDGRLNGKQAAVIVAFTWFWSLPFSLLPIGNIWGKYVPGKPRVCLIGRIEYSAVFYRAIMLSRDESYALIIEHPEVRVKFVAYVSLGVCTRYTNV